MSDLHDYWQYQERCLGIHVTLDLCDTALIACTTKVQEDDEIVK